MDCLPGRQALRPCGTPPAVAPGWWPKPVCLRRTAVSARFRRASGCAPATSSAPDIPGPDQLWVHFLSSPEKGVLPSPVTSGLGLFHLITSQRTNVLIRNLTVQRGRQSTGGFVPGGERAWKPSSTFHFDVLACRLVRPGLPGRRRCAHRGCRRAAGGRQRKSEATCRINERPAWWPAFCFWFYVPARGGA